MSIKVEKIASEWFQNYYQDLIDMKVAGGKTQGEATLNVARQTILDGRKLRLQPLNRYRERFGMKPYKTFSEFTGNFHIPANCRKLCCYIIKNDVQLSFLSESKFDYHPSNAMSIAYNHYQETAILKCSIYLTVLVLSVKNRNNIEVEFFMRLFGNQICRV